MATGEDLRMAITCNKKLDDIEKRIAEALGITAVHEQQASGGPAEDHAGDDEKQSRERLIKHFKENLRSMVSTEVRVMTCSKERTCTITTMVAGSSDHLLATSDRVSFYADELMPAIEAALQTVASKRKSVPEMCCQQLRARQERELSEAVTPVVEEPSGALTPVDNDHQAAVSDSVLLDAARSITINLIRSKRKCDDLTKKAIALRLAIAHRDHVQLQQLTSAKSNEH